MRSGGQSLPPCPQTRASGKVVWPAHGCLDACCLADPYPGLVCRGLGVPAVPVMQGGPGSAGDGGRPAGAAGQGGAGAAAARRCQAEQAGHLLLSAGLACWLGARLPNNFEFLILRLKSCSTLAFHHLHPFSYLESLIVCLLYEQKIAILLCLAPVT